MSNSEFIDPAAVEELLMDCQRRLRLSPDTFSAWERRFLASLDEHLEGNVATEAQWKKLQQIYQDRL